MKERLQKILEKRDFSDWKFRIRSEHSCQLFFIGHKLDISRSVDTEEANITVYRDSVVEGEKLRGSASASFHPTMSDREIDEKLDFLHEAAASAPNPWYPLPDGAGVSGEYRGDRDFDGKPLAYRAKALSDVLYTADDHENSWINSAEIFLTQIDETFVSSTGADLFYSGYEGLLDLVTTARDSEGREAELHSENWFSAWEPEELKDLVRKQLIHTEDRISAVPMPVMTCPDVILQGEALDGFFQYWLQASSGEAVFRKIHTTEPGEELFPGNGDKVSLRGLSNLRNDPQARPFDGNGIVLKEMTILDRGRLVEYHVGQQFAHYMGRKASGNYLCYAVDPGSLGEEELYSGSYLEIVTFSNFQMDAVTGDFGGEIRLAYWHDGSRKTVVTGGSVTGTLKKSAPTMLMSRRTARENHFLCPVAVRLEGMSLTGAG